MSKRFGRNQKRKLMQQLAVQQADVNRLKGDYLKSKLLRCDLDLELDQAREALVVIYKSIADNLNPYHPLLPSERRRQLSVTGDMRGVRVSLDNMYFRVVEILRKRLVTDEFRNLVAVRIEHGGKHHGYAIDIDSLQVESFRAEYINELSRDIAHQLVAALSNQGGAK
ncbi:MAG TPA: hypothetical protein DF774_02275 [Rheinheimera sp.]|uniref:hypothetical protein n=1 Tax=Rheinheimera sp. TaxID=1869214 RepID=UPI000EC017D6|nr:hypothetical protein [Rheinheimera sp.]HCU64567.1 hypothetical protein [Rheinheimera sp.]